MIEGDLIILDLASDSYLCLSRDHAHPVIAALAGASCDADDPTLIELRETGLLMDMPGDEPYVPLVRSRPRGAVPEMPGASILAALTLLPDFLWAFWRSMRVMRRRGARPWSGLSVQAHDDPITAEDDVVTMTDRVRRLRCLVPRTGRCLVQSLILLHLLRRRGVDADWVFGVRTHPFEAHCWVEWRGLVLNDSADHVGWYTPIAVF